MERWAGGRSRSSDEPARAGRPPVIATSDPIDIQGTSRCQRRRAVVSSPSSKLVKIGPGRNSKSPVRGLKTDEPVTSEGISRE